jgi:hypothetical protein
VEGRNIVPKTVKVNVPKVCSECGTKFTGRQRSQTCSKNCAFWAHIDKSGGPDACWPWKSHVTPGNGYGDVPAKLSPTGKRSMAHRVAWRLHYMRDPGKLYVLHRCDNRRCANPGHLFVGSQRINILDAWAKGRSPVASPGESNRHAKLTDRAVLEIRSSSEGAAALARRYGVQPHTIRAALRMLTWSHVL